MAAVAFSGVLTLQNMKTKDRQSFRFTASDVAAAFYIFPDGQNILTIPADSDYAIVDLALSAAGTDTTNADVAVNQRLTGVVVGNSTNLGTNYSRQFMIAPMIIKGGSTLRFIQRA